VIHVGIVAKNAQAAEEIASALAVEDRLEVIDVRISRYLLSTSIQPACDVVLTIALPESEMPPDGPPVVALTDAPFRTFPGPHSPHAVLPMGARTEEIVAALLAAASGLFVLTVDQAFAAKRAAGAPALHQAIESSPEKLTVRELEVLRMLADGLANKEIANALGVSDHTAKFHVSQILAKLNAASRTEAVTVGIRSGLLAI
jgi:DNA-binding CsgD family transcriptional regulator